MLMSIFLAILTTVASAGNLVLWKPTVGHPGVILPQEEGATPREAVERYWQRIMNDRELSELLKASGYRPAQGSVEVIDLYQVEKPVAVLVANTFFDYKNENGRIRMLQKQIERNGYQVFVVGLAATAGVSRHEATEFRAMISGQAEMLIALGGDDVSPSLYHEKITHARGTNLARDKEEIRLIYDFKRQEKGFFVGICRGHQMGAVADGHTLYQDLQKDGVVDHSMHRDHRHGMQWSSQAKILFPEQSLSTAVNSIHHQAVRVNTNAKSTVIGLSNDGVVEALAMKNGKGVSFQFHPEYMVAGLYGANMAQIEAGRGFLSATMALEQKTRQPRVQSCRRVY